MLNGQRILVTGGAGSIGSELVRQLSVNNLVYILDTNETAFFDLFEELKQQKRDIQGRVGDVCHYQTVAGVFKDFAPDYVFHAAARKHVTPMEWTPIEAVNVNIMGTHNLLHLVKNTPIKLVYISTDKVVNAESIMGATKKVGELMVRRAGHVVVRFGNVLGSRGSVIPIWQKQLEENRPLTVTDERMERYFMSIEEACGLVIHAAEVGKPSEVIILDMGERVNVLKAAKEILNRVGEPDHPIEMIGARPGESLTEELMTEEEKKRAIKSGRFYILS